MDSARHEAATGVGNERILANLRALAEVHPNIWVRFPVIPAVNADDANVEATAGFLCPLHPAPRVSLLPYHPTGEAKFARLGKHYSLPGTATPAPQQLDAIATRFRQRGLMATIGGHDA